MIIPLVKGLSLTFQRFFSKPITIRYPEQRWECYPRFRGRHQLKRKEDGSAKCVACQLCATVCPSECIRVVTVEGPEQQRYAESYEIDLSRCIFCGYCVEACPVGAIVMTGDYELATYNRDDTQYNMEMLLEK